MPSTSRSGTPRSGWRNCRGCGAGASTASTTGTSSTGWCASRGRSPTTATAADLFPSSRFRMAYDRLLERQPERAAKEYLRILHLAAQESESGGGGGVAAFCWTRADRWMRPPWRRGCVSRSRARPVTEVTVAAGGPERV